MRGQASKGDHIPRCGAKKRCKFHLEEEPGSTVIRRIILQSSEEQMFHGESQGIEILISEDQRSHALEIGNMEKGLLMSQANQKKRPLLLKYFFQKVISLTNHLVVIHTLEGILTFKRCPLKTTFREGF